MITFKFPGKTRPSDASDYIIECPSALSGTFEVQCGSRSIGVAFNNSKFLASLKDGSFSTNSKVLIETRTANFDSLFQRSSRYDYLNLFDTTDSYPVLSTGKKEQPCHHVSYDATIDLKPEPVGPLPTGRCFVPYSLNVDIYQCKTRYDTGKSYIEGCVGECLASYQSTAIDGVYYPIYTPTYWSEMTYTRITWYESCSYQEALSKKLPLFTYVITKHGNNITVPGYPTILLDESSCGPNYDLYMYKSKVYGWCQLPLGNVTILTDYRILNADLLIDQMSKELPPLGNLVSSKLQSSDSIWSNLILSASKDLQKLDMNNIQNILEIPGMISSFTSIYSKFREVTSDGILFKNPATKKIISKAACIYLGFHYGIKLTYMDIKEIIMQFKSNPSLLRQLRRKYTSYSSINQGGNVFNCKLTMTPKAGREITNFTDFSEILGLQLNTVNLWDMCPWSFVVDWFIPIGDFLDNFENEERLRSTYDLDYLILTMSRTEQVKWNNFPITVKVYDRYITDRMPEFGFCLGDSSNLDNHIIEAGALIINSAL